MSIRKNNKKAFSLIEISIVIVIIGILIAGITQGSRLLKASKISSAQSLTKGSPIASIPGLMVWFETSGGLNNETLISATNGVEPEDGDAITKWIDVNPQLTLKKELAPVADVNRPTYVRDGINALPSIKFTPTTADEEDFLFTAVAPISSGDDTYTIVAVFKPDAGITGNIAVVAQNPEDEITVNSSAILRTNATSVVFEGSSTTTNNVSVAKDTRGTPHIAIIRVDNGAAVNDATAINTVTFYLNSKEAFSTTKAANPATLTAKSSLAITNTSFAVGASYFSDDSREFFSGLISEVAVFDRALKKDEIESINKYLAQKYSISLN